MFRELIKRLASSLDRKGIPYMIIGGQAVLYHGEPRFTKDIDVTLGADASALGEIAELTSGLGLRILVDDMEGFVGKTMVLPAEDPATGIRVDFIFSNSEYERQAIDRAVGAPFGDVVVRIASLEDVIVHKVIAGRPRDMEDVKTILLRNPGYDRNYILSWLGGFDKALGEDFTRRFNDAEKDLG